MSVLDEGQRQSFEERGFAGPFELIGVPDAIALTKSLTRAKSRMFFWNRTLSRLPVVDGWFLKARWGAAKSKLGLHAVSADAYRLGSDPRIVARVSQVLGPDLLLCSSMLINQRPGITHYWHHDVEATVWNGLTVWIALANVSKQSTMRIVARSHRLPVPPPEGLDDAAVLAEAQKHDPACRKLDLPARPGQFYILARHLWHSSWNESARKRCALVLHYCGTDALVRFPARPPRLPTKLIPSVPYEIPCCLVSGVNRDRKNLVVSPPRSPTAPRRPPIAGTAGPPVASPVGLLEP